MTGNYRLDNIFERTTITGNRESVVKTKQKFFPEPGYVPRIYAYGRVSHPSQLGDRDEKDPTGSLTDQRERMVKYIEYMQKPGNLMDGAVMAEFFMEPKARSAYSKPFRSRPKGREIFEKLLPGDHLVVDKFDRLFRDQHDFVTMRRWFDERGITVHFVEFMGMAGTMKSRAFQMICSIKAIFAEDESANTSERTCLARSALRAAGKDSGVKPPFFCRFVGSDPTKKRGHTGKLVMCDWAVPTMEKIAWLKDTQGLGYQEISKVFMRNKVEPKLDRLRIKILYEFYRAWDGTGRPDINTLKYHDFTRAWWANNAKEKTKTIGGGGVGQDALGWNDHRRTAGGNGQDSSAA